MKPVRRALILAMLAACLPAAAADLPGDSVYRLPVTLVDQDGRTSALAQRRGTPQLVSMFYTSCQYVCPLIIETMKRTQQALLPAERAHVRVLLVSFDPERDTPQRLRQVYAERKLDKASWTLARTDAGNVRALAAVLDIQYRALANREINHSSALVLLDSEGRIAARTDKIGELDPEFVAKVQAALREQ
jgi:protein SCO1/2